MEYKTKFKPAELLCKTSLQWIPFEKAFGFIEKNLVEFGEKKDEQIEHKVKVVDQSKTVHYGVTCDGCKKPEFSGVRHKCEQCDNFDFCPSCYEKKR